MYEREAPIYKSKVKCPKCGSLDLSITEITENVGYYDQENGYIRHYGYFEPGNIISLRCECIKCGHDWKPRKVTQLTDLYEKE